MSILFRNFDMAEIVAAYIECALWSTNDGADESGGEPLDENYGPEDLNPKTRRSMRKDVYSFVYANRKLLRASSLSDGQIGHDFWLTRNRHGAGFWDHDLGQIGSLLSDAAKAYGGVDLVVCDGQIFDS